MLNVTLLTVIKSLTKIGESCSVKDICMFSAGVELGRMRQYGGLDERSCGNRGGN